MDSKHFVNGGIEAQHHSLFPTYAFLFYLLIRRLDVPELQVIIEPSDGSDAKFIYKIDGEGTMKTSIEIVDFRRLEFRNSTRSNQIETDHWFEGAITLQDLRKWFQRKLSLQSATDVLNPNHDTYYTVIAHGNVSKQVESFIPKGISKNSIFRGYQADFSRHFPINYQHQNDPMHGQPVAKRFGTEDMRRRIRLLQFPSPPELEALSQLLLENFYGVSSHLSFESIIQLRNEITTHQIASSESQRRLIGRDVERIISGIKISKSFKEKSLTDKIDTSAISSGEDKSYTYQVALSFAGEDRSIVKSLADLLTTEGVSVFYDQYEQSNLWGKDLYQHLQYVYSDAAQFCVIFISRFYAKKLWARHELKQAQARAFRESREYILPIRLDDTAIPGIPETVGYIDIRQFSLEDVMALLVKKIESLSN